jgi:hypothetical protein
MPKRSKRNNKRRGSSSERKEDGSAKGSDNVASDVGSQDDSGSHTVENPEVTTGISELPGVQSESQVEEVAVWGEESALPPKEETFGKSAEAEETSAGLSARPESPAKDDQILDAAAASPFLTPSGLNGNKATGQDVELTFSPGSDTEGKVVATAEETAPVETSTDSPALMVSDSPGMNQTAIRVSPPLAEEDMLRQSVDLASMVPVPQTPATAQPLVVSEGAIATDGSITVSVQPLEIVTAPSPAKTDDRSGSIPLSTKSQVAAAYPQSPAQIVIPTPSAANPPAPSVAVLENANSTLAFTPKTPSLAIPPVPVASSEPLTPAIPVAVPITPQQVVLPVENPAHERSTSRDRISAFISVTDSTNNNGSGMGSPLQAAGMSPPRGAALDSMALSEDPVLSKSIPSASKATLNKEPEPMAITASSAGPEGPFMPIDFEAAVVRLTGRTGKSVREGAVRGKPAGFLSKCATCFGLKKVSEDSLSADLLEDKDMQETLFSTPFDSQFEVHRRLLQTLAGGSVGLIGDEWKVFGFRSIDPAEELNEKGNGVFHALCMLYAHNELGVQAKRAFGTSSIALSSAVVALAKAGDLNRLYNKERQVLSVTCHVYCALLKKFLEVGNVQSVVVQAQSPSGLADIISLLPFPEYVSTSQAVATKI